MPYKSSQAQLDYWKQYREKHAGRYREQARKYSIAHKDAVAVTKKKWATANHDKLQAYYKEYNAKRADKDRAYRMARKEHVAANKKIWRNKNKDKHNLANEKWRKKNPEKVKSYRATTHRRRRALKLGCEVNPESIRLFTESIRSKNSVPCYYCQKPTKGKLAHIDHIIPLSKGGPHSIENLCATCPKCNQTKHNKMLKDWMLVGQQILAL